MKYLVIQESRHEVEADSEAEAKMMVFRNEVPEPKKTIWIEEVEPIELELEETKNPNDELVKKAGLHFQGTTCPGCGNPLRDFWIICLECEVTHLVERYAWRKDQQHNKEE